MNKRLQQEIAAFESHHKAKTMHLNLHTWSYYDIGRGDKTIVIFPDIMGTYESWFPYIAHLSKNHRVVIPFYPDVNNLDEMVSSLHAFLEKCHVSHSILIGASLGGLFAQMYVRKYPKEVEKLLLVATGTADKIFGVIAAGLFTAGIILPEICIKYLVCLAAYLSLALEKNKKDFWLSYIKEQIWKVNTKPSMLAWGKCVLELCWKKNFYPSDLKDWNKPLCLIEADNDIVFNPLTRHHLRHLYPQAKRYTLAGANHLIWINRFDEVLDILRKCIL